MAEYNLDDPEDRQAARDAGYWVGKDENGNIVAEYTGKEGGSADPNAPDIGSSSGSSSGGGSEPATQTGGGITQSQFDAALEKINNALTEATESAADRYKLEQERLAIERERLKLEQDRFALDKQKAESDMQLARNADDRAAAMLKIEQADLELRQNAAAQAKIQYETDMAQRKYEFEVSKAQRDAEFERSMVLKEREFEQGKYEYEKNLAQRDKEFTQSQYTDLATSLLEGAAKLRGPRDWLQYSKFTSGGQDLVEQLFGGDASAAFGGESGQSPAISIEDVLASLGYLRGGTQSEQSTSGQSGSSSQQQDPTVPLPHQVNPAVWDSMSQSARELALGLAEGGKTERGVYTAEDYERILNASRPQGTASRITKQQYQAPVGSF